MEVVNAVALRRPAAQAEHGFAGEGEWADMWVLSIAGESIMKR
jgi:hypothetical protein